MKYLSTRAKKNTTGISFSEATLRGLAKDGGLYVPESFPYFDHKLIPDSVLEKETLSKIAETVLAPWLIGDELEGQLKLLTKRAFTFPVPLTRLENELYLLELSHGPTLAFKDVGAKFLAECLDLCPTARGKTVLVATSGDTGGAVAAAFYEKPGLDVVILYPKGGVSERQELQLCTWGKNIRAFAVRGSFDDCQALVKQGFLDPNLQDHLLSANSINLARLLAQTLYYAKSSLTYLRHWGREPGFIIPTGNLGNALAALWAKKMGFPLRSVVLATNANQTLVNYFKTGLWQPQASISTLANAMDVGNPSNAERLFHLYPNFDELRRDVRAYSVTDEQISRTIERGYQQWGRAFCPHTAAALCVSEQLREKDWILVETAHPAKFVETLSPLIPTPIETPERLQAILSKKKQLTEIAPQLEELRSILKNSGSGA
ncbi:MAG: threonine synthase [Oligoflexales bacterium]|nr:threonine synthase [Oligoflexales bacterium]